MDISLNQYEPLSYESTVNDGNAERGQETIFGGYLKTILLGGIDGLNLSILVISVTNACDLKWDYVIALSFAAVVSTAVVASAGEFFSSHAHKEFIRATARKQTWNYKVDRNTQMNRLIESFVMRGLTRTDAELMVKKAVQNEKFFIDLVVSEEIGTQVVLEESDVFVLGDVVIMFLSHVLFGSIPIAIFFVSLLFDESPSEEEHIYATAIIITALCLFVLGALKSFLLESYWLSNGMETMSIALITSGIAYTSAYYCYGAMQG